MDIGLNGMEKYFKYAVETMRDYNLDDKTTTVAATTTTKITGFLRRVYHLTTGHRVVLTVRVPGSVVKVYNQGKTARPQRCESAPTR